jgi:hypothetical protein
METDQQDRCVKNVTANLQPTTIDAVTKFITEKNVILVSESPAVLLSQLHHGNEQVIQKNTTVKCVDLQHVILIN